MLGGISNFYKKFGFIGLLKAMKQEIFGGSDLFRVHPSGVKTPFDLRLKTSDIPTYDQIFVRGDYKFSALELPRVIVDAGANIGLASIYFANRFPDAKIIAIEPEHENFQLMKKNLEPYPNVVALNCALWSEDGEINLMDSGEGSWGFVTEPSGAQSDHTFRHAVPAITVDTILSLYSIEKVDLLKIDIEGAEKEVFEKSGSWMSKVDALVVELHDRMKPGCSRSFYNATQGFCTEWHWGENVFLSRGNLKIYSKD